MRAEHRPSFPQLLLIVGALGFLCRPLCHPPLQLCVRGAAALEAHVSRARPPYPPSKYLFYVISTLSGINILL